MQNDTMTPEKALGIVSRIVHEIALHTQDIEIAKTEISNQTHFNIRVNKGDTPRLIGASGAHHKALQKVVKLMGFKANAIYDVFILDPIKGQPDRYGRFNPVENWDKATVMGLLADVCDATFRHPVKIENTDWAGGKTTLDVIVDLRENAQLILGMKLVLNTLFNAVGRRHGRILMIDVRMPGEKAAPTLDEIFGPG